MRYEILAFGAAIALLSIAIERAWYLEAEAESHARAAAQLECEARGSLVIRRYTKFICYKEISDAYTR